MKPYVICHMMSPIDGKLVVNQWSGSTGRSSEDLVADYDRVHYELKCDAWIAGRAVGEEYADGTPHPPHDHGDVERPIHVTRSGSDEYAVLIDPDGKLHWSQAEIDGAPIIMVLGRNVPDAHLAELASDGISYIVAEGETIDLAAVLADLHERFGIKRIILEGGAHTNGTFFKAGLVDEVSLLVFPAIGGRSDAPTPFEASEDGLADHVRLSMSANEMRRNGVVPLRYTVSYV